jgi:hypothetical protein
VRSSAPRLVIALFLAGGLGRGVIARPTAAEPSTGRIHGRVTLTATSTINPPIRMGMDPVCSASNAGRHPVQEFVVRATDGGLANVFVHLQGSFPAVSPPAAPVILEQHGCIYQPHVVGLQVGQTLRVVNADQTTHNVHSLSELGNAFNISQPRGGEPFQFTMTSEELMLRVTCDVHAWMNIYVGVVEHPYFAVTAADGTFDIDHVPAGHQRIEVWHERFGPLHAEVDVVAGQTAAMDFTFTGTEHAAPASAR